MATRLFVGNLSYGMTEDQLRDLFESYGQVNDVAIITERDTGRSKGFGFVEFESDDEAQEAIQALNENEIQGRRLTVNVARPRNDRGDRGDRGGGDRRRSGGGGRGGFGGGYR